MSCCWQKMFVGCDLFALGGAGKRIGNGTGGMTGTFASSCVGRNEEINTVICMIHMGMSRLHEESVRRVDPSKEVKRSLDFTNFI